MFLKHLKTIALIVMLFLNENIEIYLKKKKFSYILVILCRKELINTKIRGKDIFFIYFTDFKGKNTFLDLKNLILMNKFE